MRSVPAINARVRRLRAVSAAQRLHNIDGKCHTAASHTRNQGLITNLSNRLCPAHGLWRDVTDVCPASNVRDCQGCTKWDRRSETVATVSLSTLQCLDCPCCAGTPVVSEWGSGRGGSFRVVWNPGSGSFFGSRDPIHIPTRMSYGRSFQFTAAEYDNLYWNTVTECVWWQNYLN